MVIMTMLRRGKVIGASALRGSLGVWIAPVNRIGVLRRTMGGRIGEGGLGGKAGQATRGLGKGRACM